MINALLIGVSKSGQNLSSMRRLFEDYSKTIGRLFEDYSKTIRRLFQDYSKTIRRLFKHFSKTIRKLFEDYLKTIRRLFEDYSKLVKNSTVQAYEVKTKQIGFNAFILEIKNSTKSMPVVCLYHTQRVEIQEALWTKELDFGEGLEAAGLHEGARITASANNCSFEAMSTGKDKWERRTQQLDKSCRQGACLVPAQK